MNGGAGFALPMVMGESSFPMYGRGSSPKEAGPVFFMPSKITREVSLMNYADYMCM